MEYHQITLNEWLEAKEKLRRAVLKAANGFIELGYELRQIEEQRLYEAGGYSSIAEFAEKEPEFGLSPSLVSRLISVNKAFADPEHPRQIKTDYNRYGMAKLTEMLNLPESDREMIRPETRRDDIRELKRFNKESEKAAVDLADEEHGMDDMHILVRDFFEKNAEILNTIYSSEAYTSGDITKMAEIVNPSGNKTFRKGITIMMMYEDSIKIKKMGGNPETLRWSEFFSIMQEIFEQAAAGSRTWDKYFNAGGEDESNWNDGTDGETADNAGEQPCEDGRGIQIERTGEDSERDESEKTDEEGGGGQSERDEEQSEAGMEIEHDEDPAGEEPEEKPWRPDGINPPTADVDNVDNGENCARAIEEESAEILNETEPPEEPEVIVDESGKPSPEDDEAAEQARKERVRKAVEKVNELIGYIETEIDAHHWPEAEEKTEQMLKALSYLRKFDNETAYLRAREIVSGL